MTGDQYGVDDNFVNPDVGSVNVVHIVPGLRAERRGIKGSIPG